MKLNTEKKVLLCQKALYTKQLVHYKELCAIYQELANIAVEKFQLKDTPNATVADQVQDYYGKYLTLASKGDLSFLQHNGTTERGFLTAKFNKDQIRLFKNYAKAVNRVSTFKEASGKLHDATYYNDEFDISPELMDEYHEFMQSDNETRSFDNFIAENSKRWIGHISYRRAAFELDSIKKIDPNHVAVLGGRALTPKSFGATITGAKGKITPVTERLSEEFDDLYTVKEHENYDQKISTSEKLGAISYRAGYHAKESLNAVYTAHKGTLQKALKKAAFLAVTLGVITAAAKGVGAIGDAIEFNKTSAYTNNESGYSQTIDDETMQTLHHTDAVLEALENSTTTPSADELHAARDLVDDEINLVISDLVTNSFHEKYPNLTIPEGGVTIQYNDAHIDPESGKDGNYIFITCQDINGKTYNFTIEEFASQGKNRTVQAYEDERAIDDLVSDINLSHSGNYENNTISVKEIIEEMKQIHENTVQLAGSAGSIDIPEANYANKKAVDQETVWDLLRAKYSKTLGFLAEPKFKLVIPEKNDVQITTPSTVIENDGDER